MDSGAFRSALGAFATGVTIVTTLDGEGRDVGLTANSFNSVSLDPPLILWSLAKTSGSFAAFAAASHFAVHILGEDQQALSDRFARKGIDKFEGLAVERGESGIPLLSGCAARFRCRPAYQYDGGDHVIFVGEVLDFEHSDRTPLVFHAGRYATTNVRPASADDGGSDLAHLFQRVYFHLLTPVRAERQRLGVSLHDHYLLSILAGRGACTLAEANAIVDYTGIQATAAQAEALAGRGLIERLQVDGGEALRITAAGRQAVVSLLAASKAVEADLAGQLSADRLADLKQLLRSLLTGDDREPFARVSEHMALLEQVRSALS